MSDSLKAFDKVLADVQEIKEKGNFLPNCSTKEGYEASKNYVLKVTTPARTALASAHKEAKAFYLEGGRSVDSKKNELMELLLDVQKPHQEAYKAVDEEKKRVKAEKEAAIQNGFNQLRGYAEKALSQSSEFINELLGECSEFDADPSVYGKEIQAVIELQQKVMNQLTDAMTQALQFEEMQRQQADLAKKQAEFEAKEKEQREAKEAQERAEREAIQREQMRKEAEEAAAEETERLRVEAANAKSEAARQAKAAEDLRIKQAEQSKIDAEKARIEHEKQVRLAEERAIESSRQQQIESERLAKEELERLEADKKHSRSIKDQAYNCLVQGGLDPAQAKLAIKLIAARKVAHVQINY